MEIIQQLKTTQSIYKISVATLFCLCMVEIEMRCEYENGVLRCFLMRERIITSFTMIGTNTRRTYAPER